MQLIISSINHNVQKRENYDNYRYCQLEGKKKQFSYTEGNFNLS